MAKVLHKFQQDMDALGLLLHIPHEEAFGLADSSTEIEFPFVGPCWMDDLCICLTAKSNLALERALGTATGAILDTFKSFAMTPNLQPGKTAIVITPKGAGTKSWKRRLFGPNSDGSFYSVGEHHPYRVPLVTEYTHLGGKVHFSSTVKREIKARLGQAHQEFNKNRKLLYQNVNFAIDKRRELFHSLILSRLLYGAETWTIQDRQTKDYLHGGIIGLYKRLLKWPCDQPISDDEVLFRTGMPSPSELLRVRRLRYLGSLMAVDHTACWGLLNQDLEWQELVQDDFRRLWHHLQNCSDLGDPTMHLPRWVEIIRWHRGYWRRLVRRALEHAVGVHKREFLIATAHTRFVSLLEDFDFIQRAQEAEPAPTDDGPVFGCMSCQISCRTLGGEGAHMHRSHGSVHPVRALIGSTQCGACLKEYFTMGKLKAHLIRSDACRTTLIGRGHREQPLPGLGSIEDTLRKQSWDNRLPPLPAEGPRLPDVPRRDFEAEHGGLYEDIIMGVMEIDIADFETYVRECISSRPISWTLCRRTLQEVHNQCQPGIPDMEPQRLNDFLQIIARLMLPSSWPFLLKLRMTPVATNWGFEEIEQRLAGLQILSSQQRVPRPLGKERVFLHAFSGRRRPGDLQHYLEAAFGRNSEGVILHVVSMDVVIDEHWGDACNQETRDFWLRGAVKATCREAFAALLARRGVKHDLRSWKISRADNHGRYAHWRNCGGCTRSHYESCTRWRWATSYSCSRLSCWSALQSLRGLPY